MTEQQITQMMKSLECSRDEAIQVILDDMELDGKTIKELEEDISKEQKQNIKSMLKGAKSVDAYGKKRIRVIKEDVDKRYLINLLIKSLADSCENVTATNPQKYIEFEYNGKPYLIDLKFSRNKAKGKK